MECQQYLPRIINENGRTGKPVGSRVSANEKGSRLSTPDRDAEGSSERTFAAASNDFTTERLQVVIDTIAAAQRTNDRLMDSSLW